MKHKRRSVLCCLLAMIIAAGIGGLACSHASAGSAGTSDAFYRETGTESVVLEPVDKTKGVTYILSEAGGVTAVNLNGNSAVIQSVENKEDEKTYTRIYIDTNKNGEVDAGETAVKLPRLVGGKVADETDVSEDIDSGLPIFGVYQAIATDPIVLTNEGNIDTLFGAYKGEVGDITINNTGNVNIVMGANESAVQGNIILNNTGANTDTTFGTWSSSVTGDITVTQKNSPAGYVMAANKSQVTGNITLTVSFDEGVSGNCRTVFGAHMTTVKGKVRLYHRGGAVLSDEYAVYDGSVESEDASEPAVIVDLRDGSSTGQIGAVYNASVTSKASTAVQYVANNQSLLGNIYIINSASGTSTDPKTFKITAAGSKAVAVDVDILGESSMNGGAFYGVYSPSDKTEITGSVDVSAQFGQMASSASGEHAAVKGRVQVEGDVIAYMRNLYASTCYGAFGEYNTSNFTTIVTGNLTLDMTGCQITGAAYGACNVSVLGSLCMTGDEASYINYAYGASNATITGSADVSLYGYDPETSRGSYPTTFYGVQGYYAGSGCAVKQGLDIKLLGGTFGSIYAANNGGSVQKDVTLQMSNVAISTSAYCNIISGVSIGGNVTITAVDGCSLAGSITCVNQAGIEGDVKINIKNAERPSEPGSATFYGVQTAEVKGDLDITVDNGAWSNVYGIDNRASGSRSYTVGGTCTVDLKNTICTYSLYGINGGVYEKTVDVTLSGIENYKSSSLYFYGEKEAVVQGNMTLTSSDNKGIYYCNLFGGGSFAGDVMVKASNMDITSNFNGVCYPDVSCTGNFDVTLDKVKAQSWYGISTAINCGKRVTFTANACEGTNYSQICSSSSGNVAGGMQIDLNACQFNGVSTAYMNAAADSQVNITGGSYHKTGSSWFLSANGTNGAKVNLNFKGVDLQNTGSNWYGNSATGDMVFEVLIDDECVLPEGYEMNINNSSSACPTMGRIKNDYYFAGTYPVTAQMLEGLHNVYFQYFRGALPSFTADNIYFSDGAVAVPAGEKVTAKEGITFNNLPVLLEGTLEGSCQSEPTGGLLMYGGSYADGGTGAELIKYYPVTIEYDNNAMTVTKSGFVNTVLLPDVVFAAPETVPSIRCTKAEGYEIVAGTYQAEGDETASNMQASTSGNSTTFTFDMVDKPVTVTIESIGNTIEIGKSVADPVAVLNHEYTETEPLYDFDSLWIYNDSSEGTVSYALAENAVLPTGLTLKDGKLIGTATVENSEGTPVSFVVTGKNGSSAEVILNIIVSSDPNAQQTSQDGRIVVNDGTKTINCMGSSVIIKSCDAGTAIYLDDNRDGVADYTEPAVQGDFTDYTLYGLHTYEITKPIRITMEGGTIKNLHAVYDGKVTTSDCKNAVSVYLQGGTISQNAWGAVNSVVTEGVYVKRTDTTVASVSAYNSASQCGYGYLDNNNVVTVSGAYTLTEDLSVNSFVLAAGTGSKYTSVTVAKGVTLTAASMRMNNYCNIYNKGTVNCTGQYTTSGTYVYHYVMDEGKVLPEDNTFSYLYYPITVTCEDLPKNVAKPTINAAKTYDGVGYGCTNVSSTLRCTNVAGYSVYYSVNNGEEISLGTSSSQSIYGERKPTNVNVVYVANEIEAVVKFGAPTAVIGTEYTEEAPLYDYATVSLQNDTSAAYGEEPTYVLARGSSLPAGLSLKEGKVIGTPEGQNQTTVPVTVVITGRNGTSTQVTLNYEIMDTAEGGKDINDVISFTGSVLDLNGASVVMHAASNSSKVNIYLDENHDGIADNANAFTYKGSSDINLASAVVYGYRNTAEAYDGDISIYVYGGTIGTLYGAYGTGASQNVTINGKVSLYMRGKTIIGQCVAAGWYTSADELNLDCTGGTYYRKVYAAYYPGSVKNVHFNFTENAMYSNPNSGVDYTMAVTAGGTVTGNVYATVGGANNSFSISSYSNSREKFYGVYQTAVGGNVYYTVQGNWYTYRDNNHFAYKANIAGDMDIDWKKGRVAVSSANTTLCRTFANACTMNHLRIQVDENATSTNSSTSTMYPYYGGKIQYVYMDVPESASIDVTSDLVHPYSGSTYPEKIGYMNVKGNISVMGEYTVDEDMDVYSITVHQNAKMKIAEGVTLTSKGTVTGNGDIENAGVFVVGGTVNMAADTTLMNTGTMTNAGAVANSGTITNNGEWISNGNVALTNAGNIVNKGQWTSKNLVYMNAAASRIVNEHIWNAQGAIYVQTTGAKLTNAGQWTTDNVVQITKSDAVVENSGSWNMNYGLAVNSGRVENTGIFTGRYKGTSSQMCVYITNGKILNTGNWGGNAYLYIRMGVFDNAGTMEINPRAEGNTSYNLYLYNASTSLINRENADCVLNAQISSAGNIVNYGTVKQTIDSRSSMGTIYNAGKLDFPNEMSSYNGTFYYLADVEYPETALTGVTLAQVYSSGIEGDDNQYLKAGYGFTVTIDGYQEGFSDADVKSVTYGLAGTEATASATQNQWQGTMPYEKTTVQIDVVKNNATQIEIAPTEVTVDKLTVDQKNNAIYDLKNLKITGDDGTEGSVNYAVSVVKPLPEGLTLSNGIISGTPKYASAEPYTAEIIVTGKNLTKATLKLTFTQIEKAVPTLRVPTGIYGWVDYTLAQVSGVSNPTTGTFSWPDSSLVITEKCIAGEKFDLYFTPKDTDNYDWSKISASTGKWNAEEGRVECKVSITMYKTTPSYTVPADITAVYGQTLEEVELPSDANGSFVWRKPDTLVGSVGSRSFYADYVPKDTDRYNTVGNIRITVTVQPKEVTAPIPENLVTFKGNTIGQVELPKVEAGTYKWLTASSTEVEEGKTYKAVFIPEDTTNYKWTIGEGASYSTAYGGYVFDVTIDVQWHEEGVHTYVTKYDETGHWKECICGDIIDKEAHTLGDLKNKGATHIAACTAEGCGYSKEEAHTYTKKQDATYHWSECGCGDILTKVEHAYTKTVYDDTKHWKECSCGMKSEEAAHAFDTAKSDSASHWMQCSCGAKSDVEKHSYTEVAYDEDNHWYACSCGAKNSVEAHTYGSWICDEENDVHYAMCDCGSRKTAPHSYGEYISEGAEEHKQVCTDCGKEILTAHSWDAGVITVTPTQLKEGLKIYTCTACGETKEEILPKNEPPHPCNKELRSYNEEEHWIVCDHGDEYEIPNTREKHTLSDWITDTNEHYKKCTAKNCGYRTNIGEHEWQLVAGTDTHWYECTVCGMIKSEAAHSYRAKSDEVNHWKECACGKRIDVEQHAYVSYKYDAKTHWDECSCGKKANVTSHSYGKWTPDTTDITKHYRTCICGSKETADHSEEYVWTSKDADSHTGVCADCKGGSVEKAHEWDAGRVTVSPTETTEGVRTYTCVRCKATKTEPIEKLEAGHTHVYGGWSHSISEHWKICSCGDEVDRAAHKWNAGIVTKEPTESETGEKVYSCTVCNRKKYEELPKLTHAHNYSETYTYDETYHWRACACDAVTDKAEHSWNKGQVIKPATMEETGTMQYTCTVCGAVKLSILPKLEETHVHSFGPWVTTDDISHTRTCSCGAKETETHNFGSWTEDGVNRHKKTCTECDHVIYEKHAWDAGKVTTEATEETAGIITYTCKVCGAKKTEAYTIEDHVHKYGACTPVDENTHKQSCEECGDEFISIHMFDEGVVTKKPTMQTEGVKTYTCTECGYKKTEAIEKLPPDHVHTFGSWVKNDSATHKKICEECDVVVTEAHSWDNGVITVAASETAEGVMTYTCTVCGETRTEAIAKLPPTTEAPTTETPTTEQPTTEEQMQGEPVGTKLTDAASQAKFTVVNPSDIDPEDTDTSPAVTYTGSTKASAKEITIPDTITVGDVSYRVVSIADKAFKNNKKLTKVTIGKNVKIIGNSAFENCKVLKTVTFKKTSKVKTIGKKAFFKCIALKKITIPKSVVTIKDSAFDGCKKLAAVTFQSGSKLKKLGKKVFNGCVVLKKITIPKKVTSIGSSAFSGCKKLATVTIQSTKLKTVGKNAFKGIKSNAKIKVPSKQLKAYKKLLKNKGQGKKVKITK